MKILVTGGNGFIGSNFINQIIDKPEVDCLINLDALTYAGHEDNVLDVVQKNPKYRFEWSDINDFCVLEMLHHEHDIDTVVHFAAESHVDRSIEGADDFITTNINGTFSLLNTFNRLWKDKTGKRFIHVSTDEVFGSLSDSELPFTKYHQYKPNSPYAASKAASDLLVRSFYQTHKFPAIITNCSNNFGPNQHEEKLIPLVINRILDKKPIPVYGTGLNVRDWIFVEDHCKCIWDVLTRGSVGNQYLIGGDNEMSNIDIIKRICNIMESGMDLITYVEDRKGHDFRYAIDNFHYECELGKIKHSNFSSALSKTISYYVQKRKTVH